MGPYGSVGAHIKTGRSPMAHDHFGGCIKPYRAIWTHFRPMFMIFIDLILQTGKSCWHLGHVHDTFTKDSR